MQILKDLSVALGIHPVVVLIQAAGFWILFLILRALLWKPVSDVMDARAGDWKTSEKGIEAARGTREALQAEYGGKMAVIERQAYEKLTALVKEGVGARSDQLVKAQDEATRSLAEAQAAIRGERDKALRDAGPQVDSLAKEAAARVLGVQS
ncbi:MAG: F-type H+-transporting ATPase subunit [Planctomycetota bacterium]|nr:MAG: F-type H+-transporting ATPase subunit [Planctomycetota bacterium]